MKAYQFRYGVTSPINPEGCIPYDGYNVYDTFKPLDTNLDLFLAQEEAGIEQSKAEYGVVTVEYVGVVDLNDFDETYVLYDSQYMTEQEADYEKYIGQYEDEYYKQEQAQYAV